MSMILKTKGIQMTPVEIADVIVGLMLNGGAKTFGVPIFNYIEKGNA